MNKDKHSSNEYISFYVWDKLFAIESDFVDNIIMACEATETPNSNKFIEGVIVVRDNTIPLLNLPKYLYNNEINEKSIIIICRYNNEYLALRVDSMKSIIKIDDNNKLLPMCNILKSITKQIKGFIVTNNIETSNKNEIVQILDIDYIYADVNT